MRHQAQKTGAWRHAVVVCYGVLLFSISNTVQAASLGKIEVASPIGQPLYAEVPLKLEANELASKIFIEIASAADYEIFEVYRDPVLNTIRADVASDKRGVRVKLTSRIAMQSPFFNLVLKIRYGRVSHFKKYSVFLDTAKSIQRVAEQAPVPHVEALAPALLDNKAGLQSVATKAAMISSKSFATASTASAGQTLISQQDMLAAKKQLNAQQTQPTVYQGWARTEKYGPIVRGDTLSVVAQRLRVDQRYSINQVMVALFEKNKKSFNKNNLNLIKAKSFLQVPSAAAVERKSKSEANRITREHRQAWKQQPRYALESELQRSRYSPHVSVGNQADGQFDDKKLDDKNKSTVSRLAAVKPVPATQDLLKPETSTGKMHGTQRETGRDAVKSNVSAVNPAFESLMQAQAETNQLLVALQQKNEQLQQQLIANKGSVDALNAKVDEGAMAASNARMEKLELLLTRLQAELEKKTQNSALTKPETLDWVTWLLLSLVIIMLAVIAMLMRKEPDHPAFVEQTPAKDVTPEFQEAVESEPALEHLEEAVEQEVDAIETDEKEVSLAKATGTFDAMAAFTDELSDTDTAELEAFDVDAKQELDPDVDYLSEAEVYIRYGMDEEALQQLDMALRLNPEHVEAHIKKAKILNEKSDQSAFVAALASATAVLGATALTDYNAAVEGLAGDADMRAVESDIPMVEGVDTIAPVTMTIDDAEIDALDFDLSDLNAAIEDPDAVYAVSADEQTNTEQLSSEKVATDRFKRDESEIDKIEIDQINEPAAPEALEELDWLSDPAFDSAVATLSDDQADVALNPDQTTNESGLLGMSAATQQLDSLLGEFSDHQTTVEEPVGVSDEENTDLQGLLSEFTEQDGVGIDSSHRDSTVRDDFEAGATQHLDSLLNEFSDDDDLTFVDNTDDFDPAVIEQAKSSAELEPTAEDSLDVTTTHVDVAYGATQELDSLLAEFSDDDDGLSFIDGAADKTNSQQQAANDQSFDELDLDHGATQELNSLLGEFSTADQADNPDEVDHGATQVLGRLLDEFSSDDDKDKKKS